MGPRSQPLLSRKVHYRQDSYQRAQGGKLRSAKRALTAGSEIAASRPIMRDDSKSERVAKMPGNSARQGRSPAHCNSVLHLREVTWHPKIASQKGVGSLPATPQPSANHDNAERAQYIGCHYHRRESFFASAIRGASRACATPVRKRNAVAACSEAGSPAAAAASSKIRAS